MLILRLILVTLFIPIELSFFIFNMRLTVIRLIFLVLTPILFVRLGLKIANGSYRFVLSDIFVLLCALWMFVGAAAVNGIPDALAHSGPVALEWLMAYMSTRVLLAEKDDAIAFISLLCLMLCFVVLDACLDTVSGRYFTHELLGSITGYNYIGYNEDNYRFGLLRAAGPLEHPIGFGFACAVGLVLSVGVRVRFRSVCIIGCSIGLIICISSAPQQCAVMGLGLLAYSRVLRVVPGKWLLISLPPLAFMALLFELTPTPFGHLFDLFTINSSTAYYRLYIWNAVGPVILDNPLFAVLEDSYEYRGSVDSLWLVLSLSYGMPCAIFAALAMLGCCSLPTCCPPACLNPEQSRAGTALGIIVFLTIFMSFTVHFWGPVWIMIGLLLGVRAHLGEYGRLRGHLGMDVERMMLGVGEPGSV
jgi:hypothetical protein